jgi:hypothetical protein
MGKTGINARNIRQDWLMRLLCNWLALHTSEPVPEGIGSLSTPASQSPRAPIRKTRRLFFWLL